MRRTLDPTILRAYDIRGQVDRTLTPLDAIVIGRAFGTILRSSGGSKVAVGRDGRLSSPEMAACLMDGLVSVGCDVSDIGVGPTPMLYFAERALAMDAGIMVTGSHNPADYNGFKISKGGKPFHGDAIQTLGAIANANTFERTLGLCGAVDVREMYISALLARVTSDLAYRVAWDPGNGAAGDVINKLVSGLPGYHVVINSRIDGRFPNHHPDPTEPENLVQLQRAVREHDCDLGIAFDGDGDRIGVIDSTGRIVWGDQILTILARDVLARRPGAIVIADVKTSQATFDAIARLGGEPLMWRTGHSPIKDKMAETGAPLAGEMSGHIFVADEWYGFDDAIYAAIRLLTSLASDGRPVAEVIRALPETWATPEIRIPCSEELKFPAIERIGSALERTNADICRVDGLRVSSEEGWWLLRASNTQDVIVARCEANNETGLHNLLRTVQAKLKQVGLTLPPSPGL